MASRKTWSYLVRFLAREDSKVYNGDLVEGLPRQAPKSYAGLKARIVKGDPLGDYTVTDEQRTIDRLLSPIARETTTLVRCVGLRVVRTSTDSPYLIVCAEAHVAEGTAADRPPEWPVLFVKSRMALTDPETDIPIPRCAQDETLDYEGEIAMVVLKDARDVPGEGDAWKAYVAGYACSDDVTWRKGQKDFDLCGGQWCFGKGLDNFAPMGPVLAHPSVFDPADVRLQTRLNGQTMQDARTADLISDMRKILHHFSKGTTIERGSIILTGTPAGVGYVRKPRVFLKDGDRIEVEVDGLGTLHHGVKYD